ACYLACGQRVPLMLRMPCFIEVSLRAARQYRPQRYTGSMVLFQTTPRADDPLEGWGRFAAGGVASYTVPGKHSMLMQEPQVRVLAERLTLCLHQAQALHAPRCSGTQLGETWSSIMPPSAGA